MVKLGGVSAKPELLVVAAVAFMDVINVKSPKLTNHVALIDCII